MQPKQNIHSFLKWILPFFIQILFVGHTRTHFWHCIHVVLSTLNERLLRINVLNPQFAILDNSQAFFLEDNFISNSLLVTTTSSTGGLLLALLRAVLLLAPKGGYRKHSYWPAIKRYLLNLLFLTLLLALLYTSGLPHL